ncbi:unnamed protein product [Darwinula stevensoni]|uniref:BTB domain-containing protein n=1 Tax=Darwinula stevensoni TaxID=69355 RepID=A0A7R9A134_9CRUS|nr:unnamed protein product [Darwinula stevensoni]CAG0882573.1 unnamed protein product [Darwinula stevensoni]
MKGGTDYYVMTELPPQASTGGPGFHSASISSQQGLDECTEKCKSKQHGQIISAAIQTGSQEEAAAYMSPDVQVNGKDLESGYSALHRSLFYGHIPVAIALLKNGARLTQTDRDGLTALDHVLFDRPPIVDLSVYSISELYIWGTNANYNLGTGATASKEQPDIFDFFRRDSVQISSVSMSEYHTLFLTKGGQVYSCGHGLGGRLGFGTEESQLTPKLIQCFVESDSCIAIASGSDHSLFLTQNHNVWSCGSNRYGQLGHYLSPTDRLLNPKVISLKWPNEPIQGIACGPSHSVFYSSTHLFTCGVNSGQLGHLQGSDTINAPKLVTCLNISEKYKVEYVAASEGATIVLATDHSTGVSDVFILNDYQCRKLASKYSDVQRIDVIGGGDKEVIVFILAQNGCLFIWRGYNPTLTKCSFNLQKDIFVVDLALSRHSVLVVTRQGEAYSACWSTKKSSHAQTQTKKTGKGRLKDIDGETEVLRTNRVPFIQRGIRVFCDPKGNNFALLQVHPKESLTDVPSVSPSAMKEDMEFLLKNAEELVSDVTLIVGGKRFPAHRLILKERCEYFRNQSKIDSGDTINLDGISPQIFSHILHYIYTGETPFLSPGSPMSKDPLPLTKEAAKRLHLKPLIKYLESLKWNKGHIISPLAGPPRGSLASQLQFSRTSWPCVVDVTLMSQDGKELPCHKCILMARSEYFRNMFALNWRESHGMEKVPIAIPVEILEFLLDYLYQDSVPHTKRANDITFLAQVLLVADQLLLHRLKASPCRHIDVSMKKEECEVSLVDMMTLKNAPDILDLALMCNAPGLKDAVFQFISLNLASFLDARSLEECSEEALEGLAAYYRSLLPCMSRRILTPPAWRLGLASTAELADIAQESPQDLSDFQMSPNTRTTALSRTRKAAKKSKRERKRTSSGKLSSTLDGTLDGGENQEGEKDVQMCGKEETRQEEEKKDMMGSGLGKGVRVIPPPPSPRPMLFHDQDFPSLGDMAHSPPSSENLYFGVMLEPKLQDHWATKAVGCANCGPSQTHELLPKQREEKGKGKMKRMERGIKVNLWTLSTEEEPEQADAKSPASPLVTPSWASMKETVQEMSFSQILAEEEMMQQKLNRTLSKPLSLIQYTEAQT